jgi:hypothetical protein
MVHEVLEADVAGYRMLDPDTVICPASRAAALRAAAAPEEEEEEGRGRAHGDDSEDEAPRFSELSGKLIAKCSLENRGVGKSASGSAAGGGR